MHVVQFIHRYPPAVGGAELYAERLSRYLAEQGDTVSVWTSTAIDLEAMWYRGRKVVSRDAQRSAEAAALAPLRVAANRSNVAANRYAPLYFPARRYLLKALSFIPIPPLQAMALPCNPTCPGMWRDAGRYDGPLDAVHGIAFPYAWPLMCGLRLARRRNVPFLLTPFLHLGNPDEPNNRTRRQYTSRPLRWLLRQADRVIVQTPSEFRAVSELGVNEERIVLQGLGVEPAECTGGNRGVRTTWGIQPDEVVIGHLANLSEEKGTVDLLRAAAGLSVRVVLAGPGMPNFERFWQTFPHKEKVTRLGVLTDEQKRDFFAGIDLFALPSRTDSFGLVLPEAWANSKPVVAYRAGGPADLVRDGVDGFLAKCGDVHELTERLRTLATHAEQRQRFGEAGCERVGRDFRWEDKLRLVRSTLVGSAGRTVKLPDSGSRPVRTADPTRQGTSRIEDCHGPHSGPYKTKITSP